MRILGISRENSGVGHHRVMMPIRYLQKEYGLITDVLNEEVLDKGFDVVLVNRHLNIPIGEILRLKAKYKFKLVVDNDDYWELDQWHQLKRHYDRNNTSQLIKDYISIADVCTCTHERLANEIYKINKNVYILPNALPYGEGQYTPDRLVSNEVRIFWAGSSTHVKDIEILKNPMLRLVGDKRVEVVMSGYDDIPEWKRMANHFTAGGKIKNRVFRFAPVASYMEAYKHADIMVTPLVDSTFNSMKSNLKVLEAAAKGIPVLSSAVDPYLNLPILYARRQADWYATLNQMIENEWMRNEAARNLYEYCDKHHNIKVINEERYDIYLRR